MAQGIGPGRGGRASPRAQAGRDRQPASTDRTAESRGRAIASPGSTAGSRGGVIPSPGVPRTHPGDGPGRLGRAAHRRQRERGSVRWRRASRSAASAQGGRAGSVGSTGAPSGQRLTGRAVGAAGSGAVSGGSRMPASCGAAARAIRAVSASRSVSAAWAFATIAPLRTTVPSGRSARTCGGSHTHGVRAGWERRCASVPRSWTTEVWVVVNGSPGGGRPGRGTGPAVSVTREPVRATAVRGASAPSKRLGLDSRKAPRPGQHSARTAGGASRARTARCPVSSPADRTNAAVRRTPVPTGGLLAGCVGPDRSSDPGRRSAPQHHRHGRRLCDHCFPAAEDDRQQGRQGRTMAVATNG